MRWVVRVKSSASGARWANGPPHPPRAPGGRGFASVTPLDVDVSPSTPTPPRPGRACLARHGRVILYFDVALHTPSQSACGPDWWNASHRAAITWAAPPSCGHSRKIRLNAAAAAGQSRRS